MRFIEVDHTKREQWDRFVRSSVNPTFIQSFEWGEVKSGTWIPNYLAVGDDTENYLTTALILKRRIPGTGKFVLYCPRGPVFKNFDPEVITFFFDSISIFAKKHKAILLKCDPEIPETTEVLINLFHSIGLIFNPENIQPRATIILDLHPPEDNLLQSFHHKTRYNIKLAQKKGVEIREVVTKDGVDVFYDLFRLTSDRDRFLILQKSYFYHLWETLYPKGMCAVFTAHYQNQPLAAIFQIIFGDTMTYLYGASSNEHRNLMPNHLIHWHAIQWAKSRNILKYDFWGIPSNPHDRHPLWGVYRFKKGFCETETRWIGMIERVYKPCWNWLFTQGAHGFKKTARFIRTGSLRTPLEE
jgi:peptidoglycan pentaglycine glycine transferase (the first glycine)